MPFYLFYQRKKECQGVYVVWRVRGLKPLAHPKRESDRPSSGTKCEKDGGHWQPGPGGNGIQGGVICMGNTAERPAGYPVIQGVPGGILCDPARSQNQSADWYCFAYHACGHRLEVDQQTSKKSPPTSHRGLAEGRKRCSRDFVSGICGKGGKMEC